MPRVVIPLPLLALIALVAAAAQLSTPTGRAAPVGPAFVEGTLYERQGYKTALTFGPDGRLYVADLGGISAITLDTAGTSIASEERIASDLRYVLGLVFDPTAPVPTLYASLGVPSGDVSFPGGVGRFRGPSWERENVISGLPRSPFLELTNALAFLDDGTLLIAQGGLHGSPHTPLAGAVLAADVHAPGFDGAVTYDGPATNSVVQLSGDVRVYAPGFKNPYGMIIHSNGRVYATDNGGLGPDELNLVEEGKYYGEPNLNRARFDPREAIFHPGDEPSIDEYTAPILELGHTVWEGLAEYASDAFGGMMQGDLIIASLDGSVWRVELLSDGRTVTDAGIIAELEGSALGVAVGPGGIIYVGTSSGLYYLQPSGFGTITPTPTPTQTLIPEQTLPPMPVATRTPTAALTATPTEMPAVPGDANCDGRLDSLDAALILQLTAGVIRRLPCAADADLDGDGEVGSGDALLVLQCLARLIRC